MRRALNIWVLGGDLRQWALARQLEEDGHGVHLFALEEADGARCEHDLSEIHRADCVILPLPAAMEGNLLNTPLSRERYELSWIFNFLEPDQLVFAGMVGEELARLAAKRGIGIHDYFAREELAVLNAVPTAEGAIQIAMEELPVTLHGTRTLVLGYGRVGRALAPRLAALGARTTVAARSYEALAWAEEAGFSTERIDSLTPWLCGYELVINTVPARVLMREQLLAMRAGALVIDLASKPGGVDFAAAEELGVKTVWALSLPGKVAPVTSGSNIRNVIYHMLLELGV